MGMLSIIIPIYNEVGLIDELIPRVVSAVELFSADYEILLVDDGSVDNSLKKILEWRTRNKRIKVLALSKNFGHQAAFTAGLEYAKGELVAMMDGDLQDPPELLESMYREMISGDYDVVSGKRMGHKGRSRFNCFTALFHYLFRHISAIKNMENVGNFSLMNREAVHALLMMKEKVRYLPGLRTFIGFNQGYVEYVRDQRSEGDPKMSLPKLIMLAVDAIFSFSRFPIRFCLYLGMMGTLVFMCAGFYVLMAKIMGFAIVGWSSTLLSIYFLGSIQLISIGVVGEYVFRIYKESQNRPLYFVRQFYGESGEK